MNEMLRAFYDQTLAGLQPGDTPDDQRANELATRNKPSAAAKELC